MDKGIPLPELPLDPTKTPRPPNPEATLIHGLAWTALGGGGMLALFLFGAAMDQLLRDAMSAEQPQLSPVRRVAGVRHQSSVFGLQSRSSEDPGRRP